MKLPELLIAIVALVAMPVVARGESTPAQRVAAMVSYVGADYHAAVTDDGRILEAAEYEEQKLMLRDAKRLAEALPAPPGKDANKKAMLEALARLVSAHDQRLEEINVQKAAREVFARLVQDYGVIMSPKTLPSLDRAQELYPQLCGSCHGLDGHADTPQAQALKPPPVSFFDTERMRRISPALAFNVLGTGVPGTAMQSFDSLSAADRWSLAFYVVSMRHDPAVAAQAEQMHDGRKLPIKPTAEALATLSDWDIERALLRQIPDEGQRKEIVAWLRTTVTFSPKEAPIPEGRFAEARLRLAELLKETNRQAQHELAIAAYLDGVEPHEAVLRARDRALASRVEKAFFDLRRVIDTGDAGAVRAEVAKVDAVLDEAEQLKPSQKGSERVAFLASFAVALREGFEISLLLTALLAFVRKSGHPEQVAYVHVGWLCAIPAGIITWWTIGAVMAGAERELAEGVMTLLAAGMLLFVSHFVLGRLEAKKWLGFLEQATIEGVSRPHPWPLVLMAFIAAYREAVEIVLFYRAIVIDSGGAMSAVASGAIAGILALALLTFILGRIGRRLKPRLMMTVSSIVLTVLAISMVGQGIRSLQSGGYLPVTPLPLPALPLIGLFPTLQGMLAQLVVLIIVVVPSYLEKMKARRAPAAPPAPQS